MEAIVSTPKFRYGTAETTNERTMKKQKPKMSVCETKKIDNSSNLKGTTKKQKLKKEEKRITNHCLSRPV